MERLKSSCELLWGWTVDDHLGIDRTVTQLEYALKRVEGPSYREATLFLSDLSLCLKTTNIYEALESNLSASEKDEIVNCMKMIKEPVQDFRDKVDGLILAPEAPASREGTEGSNLRRRAVKETVAKERYRCMVEQTSMLRRRIEVHLLDMKMLVDQPTKYVILCFSSSTRIIFVLCNYSLEANT
jgi:hypothetical protein